MENLIKKYRSLSEKINAINYASYLISWDSETEAPVGCFDERSKQMGVLSSLMLDIKMSDEYYNVVEQLYNSNLELSNKNTKKIYIGDYGNKKLLNQIFKENNIDIIIHLASYISISDSIKHPIKYYYNNVYKTKKLLKEMKKYKINNIIFSSSAAVYGKNNYNIPLEENFNLVPSNPYGKNKVKCEYLIKESR